MSRDTLFSSPQEPVAPFAFTQDVAHVFDDMIRRSTPAYDLLQSMIVAFARALYQPGTALHDIGCSTGETLSQLASLLSPPARLIGVDNASAMLDLAKQKCQHLPPIEWMLSDMQSVDFEPASVVILTYVLQFLPVHDRPEMLRRIARALVPGGVLILCEKVSPGAMADLYAHLHEHYKKANHYSDLEIRQKREALENVLISLTEAESKAMLLESGFASVEPFFRAYQFAGWVARVP